MASGGIGWSILPYFPPSIRAWVRTGPGQRTLTRTPAAAASIRRAVDRPTTARFVVLEQALRGGEFGDIQTLSGSLPAVLSDSSGDFPGQHHSRPPPSQRFAHRAADARSAACGDSHRALKRPR